MTMTPLERLLSRDRGITLAALAGMVGLAWLYLFRLAAATGPQSAMELAPWAPIDGALMVGMWAVMMIAMMIPSAAPMVLLFAALKRRRQPEAAVASETTAFLSGYILIWIAFSLGATAMQWGLEQLALLSPMMVSASPVLSGGVLLAAGLYQWLPIKQACLRRCRAPAQFLSEHWQPGPGGALRMGIRHGLYCLGCCWVLMVLLFVGGVMNLLWIAVIAGLVFMEKLVPHGDRLGRLVGILLAVTGLAIAFG